MVDLGCLGSLGEEPRGKGTAPYVLPGWDKAPGGRPRDCRGVDAYALAVLLREMTGPADDLVPPAIECARALESTSYRLHSMPFDSFGEESNASIAFAFLSIATEVDRKFREGLDEVILELEELYPRLRKERRTERKDARSSLASKPVSSFTEALSLYVNSWEAGIRLALDLAFRMGAPLSVFSEVSNESGKRTITCLRTVRSIANELVKTTKLMQWLLPNCWGIWKESSACEAYYEQAVIVSLREPCDDEQLLSLLDLADCCARFEGRTDIRCSVALQRAVAVWRAGGVSMIEESAGYALDALELAEDDANREVAAALALQLAHLAIVLRNDVDLRKRIVTRAAAHSAVAMNNLALMSFEERPEESMRLLRVAAARGNAGAMTNLALLIEDEEPCFAIELLEKASECGYAPAKNSLALRIELASPSRARKLFEEAVAQDYAPAMRNLALRIECGEKERSRGLLERAVGMRDAESMASLAVRIVFDSPERARFLLEESARLGCASGMVSLSPIVEKENPERARRLLERAVSLGDSGAMVNLAFFLFKEHGGEARAFSLLKRAASLGNAAAINNLALLLANEDSKSGRGNAGARALCLLELAAALDYTPSMVNLALIIESKDADRAIRLLEKAAGMGNIAAIGQLALRVEGTSPVRARQLYEKAVKANDPIAMTSLALFIEGNEEDRALELMENAAAQEYTPAMLELASRLAKKGQREEAKCLLEKAIELDSATALCDLALLLEDDDPEESRRILENAVKKGSVKAMLVMSERCAKSSPEESRRLIELAKSARPLLTVVQLSMTSGMLKPSGQKSVLPKSISIKPMDAAWKIDLVSWSECYVIAKLANVLTSEGEGRAEAVLEGLVCTLRPELLYRLSIILENDQPRMALVALKRSASDGFEPAVKKLGKRCRA